MVSDYLWVEDNLGKSELVPVGNVPNMDELANVMSCRVGQLPMAYLGLPLSSAFMERDAMERDDLWRRVVVAKYGSVWAGPLSLYRGLMEFAFGKVLGRGGTLFSILLDLRWELDPLLNFGTIHGLGGSL